MKLKPCPFCGLEARLVNTTDGGLCIECSGCLSSSRAIYPSKQDPSRELEESWNRRADLTPAYVSQTKQQPPESFPQATFSDRGSTIVAEGYFRIRDQLERLKELCLIIEPWAADRACNERSVASNDVYGACREMRPIIYGTNHRNEEPMRHDETHTPAEDASAERQALADALNENAKLRESLLKCESELVERGKDIHTLESALSYARADYAKLRKLAGRLASKARVFYCLAYAVDPDDTEQWFSEAKKERLL